MKKVLIVGSKGMAGHVVYKYFKENTDFEVVDIARDTKVFTPTYQTDVTNFEELRAVLFHARPSVVINCIGILNKDAEDNPDRAILLNTYLPHFLAKVGKELSYKFIHISTDCVFSGSTGGYTENSIKDGVGFYAETKALGEVTYDSNLTIRTSIIGPEIKENGIGLFHWFMRQNGRVIGYSNAFWSGVTTLELAKAIKAAIEQNLQGLHHLTNEIPISKKDLLTLFKDVFNKTSVEIEAHDGYRVDKTLKIADRTFTHHVPSYRLMIVEMKEWMDFHRLHYNY